MALTLNGTTQYLRIANNTLFNFTPSVTLMGWTRTTSTSLLSSMQRIAGRYLDATVANEQYGIDIYMGTPRFLIGTSTLVTTLASPTSVTAGVWTHVCGTYDGSTMNLYQDANLIATVARSGTIASSTGIFSCGADYNGTAATEYFTGSLEDIRLYNRALSQNEISTVVTCRGTGVIRNGLILNLQLDEQRSGAVLAANATIYDTAQYKLNATNIIANATFTDGFLRKRRFS